MSKRPTAKFFALIENAERNEIEHWKSVAAVWIKRALAAESKLAIRNPETAIGLAFREDKRRIVRAA